MKTECKQSGKRITNEDNPNGSTSFSPKVGWVFREGHYAFFRLGPIRYGMLLPKGSSASEIILVNCKEKLTYRI